VVVDKVVLAVEDLVQKLKCDGCEYESLGQRGHMGHRGCLSPIGDRLGIIDFDQAYAVVIDELASAWKSDVKENVFQRLRDAHYFT
jgi:hypothetical protein